MKACLYLGIAPLRPMLNLQNSSVSSASILISLGFFFFDSLTPSAFLLLLFLLFAASLLTSTLPGVAPGIFQRGADSSDEGARIWLSGYYKYQKSPKKSHLTFLFVWCCLHGCVAIPSCLLNSNHMLLSIYAVLSTFSGYDNIHSWPLPLVFRLRWSFLPSSSGILLHVK